ncbi:cytoplasmic protein [Shewanella sp. AS16]|uniref:cytoplasmic protein n=1 Tax=Shewanella sp. AS16 TaxID=2907625 RepID=UPI001F2DE1C1|nr:cytoplasmic protein [Shewanella sp. AS16]MCE9685683.1 cytoplasmic protein [Shewanella sp. AS16]
MPLAINASAQPNNVSNDNVNVKVMQLAKQQQEMQGEMVMQLIDAADIAPAPVNNTGHNIDVMA